MTLMIDPIHFHAHAEPELLGQAGEKGARTITVLQPTVPGAIRYHLLFQIPGIPESEEEEPKPYEILYASTCTNGSVTVPSVILQRAGTVWCQWIARDAEGTKIAKSNLIPLRVEPSLSTAAEEIPTPEELQSQYDTLVQKLEEKQAAVLESIASAGGSPTAVSQILEYTQLESGIYTLTPQHNRIYRFTVTDSGSTTPRPPLLKVQKPAVSGTEAVFYCRMDLQHFSAFQLSFAKNLTGTQGLTSSNGFLFLDSSQGQDLLSISLWYDGFGFRYRWTYL